MYASVIFEVRHKNSNKIGEVLEYYVGIPTRSVSLRRKKEKSNFYT